MKYLSICIPTYEMNGMGDIFLKHTLKILEGQSFKDFEVVVSDHSKTDSIENLCKEYIQILDIKYFRNIHKRGNSSANLNNAISKASGKLVKILFQDDFLYSLNSLKELVSNFDVKKDNWMVSACVHTMDGVNFYRKFVPKYNNLIIFGENTISSPSVLTLKNNNPLMFDENLIWLMDCDYYKRCYDKFGWPKILSKINTVNRIGPHQVSNTVANDLLRIGEEQYILNKYSIKIPKYLVYLRNIRKFCGKFI